MNDLHLNDCEILKDAGRVSHDIAVSFAKNENEKYRLKMISEKR